MLGEIVCVSSPAMPVCQRVSVRATGHLCVVRAFRHHNSSSWVCSIHGGSSPSAVARKPGRKVSKWLFSSDHTPEIHLLNARRLGHTSVHSKGAPWRPAVKVTGEGAAA